MYLLKPYGYGDGDDYGGANGDGNNYEYGNGYGVSNGFGGGEGDGNNYEYGNGNGNGYGDGDGYGNGYGYGNGNGYGGGSLEITVDHLICLCAVKHLTNKG
jgi:hypothetical protein